MAFNRRSIRLDGWDYRWAGWYFVTMCTHQRRKLLARVEGGRMLLTIAGQGASYAWYSLPNHVDNIRIDEFVVMPDHVHGIIRIVESGPLLGHVVRSFKAAATSEIRARCPMIGKVWQRNYYERIIRNEYALLAIRRYIVNNPSAWIARRGNDPDA